MLKVESRKSIKSGKSIMSIMSVKSVMSNMPDGGLKVIGPDDFEEKYNLM